MNEPQYHRFGNPSRVRITWDWYYVGELGWELHMPMQHLDTAYAAILEAGRKHGIVNF
jgi:glycine cleavage system aminomethyltransferase T